MGSLEPAEERRGEPGSYSEESGERVSSTLGRGWESEWWGRSSWDWDVSDRRLEMGIKLGALRARRRGERAG